MLSNESPKLHCREDMNRDTTHVAGLQLKASRVCGSRSPTQGRPQDLHQRGQGHLDF